LHCSPANIHHYEKERRALKIHKELVNLILISLVYAILFAAITSADAPPPLPNSFSGTLKFENASGQSDAPSGTVIEAFIDDIMKGTAIAETAGRYSIDVSGTYEDDGKNITFKINNVAADKIVVFNASYPPPNTLNLIIKIYCDIAPIPGMDKVPTDPDSDGLFEDINGNCRKDFNGVVMFFDYIEWIPDNEPISSFDLNGNGRIDFNDIIRLFEEL
jgi:PKD repeat protein